MEATQQAEADQDSRLAAYFEAVIPEPHRILGLKLKPFSLGHYLILKRFNCGFVAETQIVANREDLIFGVLVCSMNHEEFIPFMESKTFEKELQEWGKLVGLFDFKEKATAFMEYLEKGLKTPDFWIEEEGSESGATWVQTLITTLTGQLHYSKHEVFSMPMAQAIADFYKHAEDMGAVRLMTPDEIQQVKELEVAHGA